MACWGNSAPMSLAPTSLMISPSSSARFIEKQISKDPTIVRDGTQLREFGDSYRHDSAGRGSLGRRGPPTTLPLMARPLLTPSEEPPSPSESEQHNTNRAVLLKSLEKKGYTDLLRHLRDIRDLQFGLHSKSWASQKKLHVGHTALPEHAEIFAYLKLVGSHTEICFYHTSNEGEMMKDTLDFVVGQDLIHPFSKTLPQSSSEVDKGAKFRLSILVKWYFIDAGFAPTLTIDERKWGYMLQHIDRRMAALEQETIRTSTDISSRLTTPSRLSISTSPLVAITSRFLKSKLVSQNFSPAVSNDLPQASNNPQGSKRLRDEDLEEDTQDAEIEEMQMKSRLLRKKIRADEEELKETERMENFYMLKLQEERELFIKNQREEERTFAEEEKKKTQAFHAEHEQNKKALIERKEINIKERGRLGQIIANYWMQ